MDRAVRVECGPGGQWGWRGPQVVSPTGHLTSQGLNLTQVRWCEALNTLEAKSWTVLPVPDPESLSPDWEVLTAGPGGPQHTPWGSTQRCTESPPRQTGGLAGCWGSGLNHPGDALPGSAEVHVCWEEWGREGDSRW